MLTNEEKFVAMQTLGGYEKYPAILKDHKGKDIALKGVNIRGRLHGLMAKIEVEQLYTNTQNINIEAIYTFPLPLGATLLGLEVEIDGKKLVGCVVEKQQAESEYEDAITDGDSAIMLEEAGPGLYTVSVGNLMAGESVVIRYHYAVLLAWQGNSLRFMLPTTIAPYYGDPQETGLQPHQIPSVSLYVDYPLEISISIEGELTAAKLSSPSHMLTFERSGSNIVVRPNRNVYLDRDFILTLESETAQSSCVLTSDRENYVALASLRVPALQEAHQRPLVLNIAIDCSGSMAGSSIVQAGKAAFKILDLLQEQDSFNITLFGSAYSHIFSEIVPASEQNIAEAEARLVKLDADMGGTEMENALEAIFTMTGAGNGATLLLITDGEIYEHEKLVKRAKKSGHCVFAVGVGNAVNENFLRSLAAETGGACELVTSQEGMDERVLMQFHRMRQPKLGEIHIGWPVQPKWQTPLPDALFAGDTVQVFAGFPHPVAGEVTLTAQGMISVTSAIVSVINADIPRMAAARCMELASSEDALRLALDYQLPSRWTNFLVIAERVDKANDLPELHQVPHMLAAGWGGVGDCYDFSDLVPSAPKLSPEISSPIRFILDFEKKYASFFWQPKLPKSIAELEVIKINEEVAGGLRKMLALGHDETEVVASFIYALSESNVGYKFNRSLKRVIHKHWKQVVKHHVIDIEIQKHLALITAELWGWQQFESANERVE